MSSTPVAAIFDCNVYLQAMLSTRGAASACWEMVLDGRVRLYVSAYILAEIRRLPDDRRMRRFSKFTHERVDRFIEELLRVAVMISHSPPDVFTYSRDPDDAHYINLAIATGALLVVSNDKDLLELMDDANSDGAGLRGRYPSFRVVSPAQMLALVRS